MTEFEKRENRGRQKALEVLNHISPKFKTHLTENPYERYDIDLTGNTVYVIECKDRQCRSDEYSEWILEVDKYRSLKEINHNCIYLNTFEDGKYMLWFLNDIVDENRPTHKMFMNKHTALSNDKIEKEVFMLKEEEARIVGNINNKIKN